MPSAARRRILRHVLTAPLWARAVTGVLLGTVSPRGRADELEIIALRHQTPDRVLPVLRPLLEPGGSLSGMNNKLFLRTSPQNRAQILRVLAEIDVATRQVLIRVRQSGEDSGFERDFGMGGEIVIGRGGSTVEGRAREHRQTQRSSAEQQVRTSEGSAAFIRVGRSLPIPLRQVVVGPDGAISSETTVWMDVGQGFHAVPRISGEHVTLEIGQSADTVTPRGGELRTQRLSTSVSGRLGEWIELGGARSDEDGRDAELLGRSRAGRSSSRSILLRVDRVD